MNKCATSSLVNGKQKSPRWKGPFVMQQLHLLGDVADHERRVSQFRQGLKAARLEQQSVAASARLEKALSLCKQTLTLVERSGKLLSDFESISHRKFDEAS